MQENHIIVGGDEYSPNQPTHRERTFTYYEDFSAVQHFHLRSYKALVFDVDTPTDTAHTHNNQRATWLSNTSGNIANGTRRTLVLEKMIGCLPQNAKQSIRANENRVIAQNKITALTIHNDEVKSQ
jgi:hypothetical protein